MEPRYVNSRIAANTTWINVGDIVHTSAPVWDVGTLSAPVFVAQDIYYTTVDKYYCDDSPIEAKPESSENMGTELSWEQMMGGITNKN